MPYRVTKKWVDARWGVIVSRATHDSKSGCWEYKHSSDGAGYGLWHESLGKRRMISKLVHRLSAIRNLGMKDKAKTYVSHLCNNPPCFNPKHLHVGDQKDNLAYAAKCGRMARGEKQGCARLTTKHVKEIRVFLREGISQQKIANLYGVHRGSILAIARGHSWAWVK